MFWNLESFGDFPKEASEAWQMHSSNGIQKIGEDKTMRNPLVAGGWRAQVYWVN